MEDKLYVIEGQPIPLKTPPPLTYRKPQELMELTSRRQFENIQIKEKTRTTQILTMQHQDLPLFTGPLKLDITFYVKRSNKLNVLLLPTKEDSIDSLLEFIIYCATGAIFESKKQLIEINAKKLYDIDDPRTVFTILPL